MKCHSYYLHYFLVCSQRPSNVKILVGTNNLKQGGTYYQPKKFFQHSRYNKPAFANDIALVLVNQSVAFNDKVQSISFAADSVPAYTNLQLSMLKILIFRVHNSN